MLLSGHFPKSLGRDLAGVVEKVGPQVTDFKIGDEVYGMPEGLIPTSCEHVVCSEKSLAKKPINLSFQEAATIPLTCLTAWQSLIDKGKMKEGQKVLVLGGSGGVGSFAVQICRAKGVTCYATCGTQNVDFVRSLGASKVIDYKTQDFVQEMSGEKVDIVFDTVGMKEQRDKAFQFVKPGGTLVTTLPFEGDTLTDCIFGITDVLWKNLRHKILNGVWYRPMLASSSQSQLEEIRELVEAGEIRTFIDKEFPLERLAEAHAYSEKGTTRGKIAITVSQIEVGGPSRAK